MTSFQQQCGITTLPRSIPASIAFTLASLLLSMICVKSEKSRSAVNILSTIISAALVLMMLGIVAPAP